jgi:hypothetical protein
MSGARHPVCGLIASVAQSAIEHEHGYEPLPIVQKDKGGGETKRRALIHRVIHSAGEPVELQHFKKRGPLRAVLKELTTAAWMWAEEANSKAVATGVPTQTLPAPSKLAIVLQHDHTQRGLEWSRLDTADRVVVDLFRHFNALAVAAPAQICQITRLPAVLNGIVLDYAPPPSKSAREHCRTASLVRFADALVLVCRLRSRF